MNVPADSPVDLLAELSREQKVLVRAVFRVYAENGHWPAWDHLVGLLADMGIDAPEAIDELPAWPWATLGRYRALWTGTPSAIPTPDAEVALTVLGVAHCQPEAAAHLTSLLGALRFFAARFREEPPTPNAPLIAQVTSDQLAAHYRRHGLIAEAAQKWRVRLVRDVLDHEPSPWSRGLSRPPEGGWIQSVGREIGAFAEVDTIELYLQALTKTLDPGSARRQSPSRTGSGLVAPSDADSRVVLTVLFTDIVQSTTLAMELGDAAWAAVLAKHDGLMRRLIQKYGGREVKTTGDGFLVVFDGASQGIRCAGSFVSEARDLGLEVRAGLHLGECEIRGSDVIGIAPDIASRVMNRADGGQVLVTSTLKESVVGSGLILNPVGMRTLKGLGKHRLFALSQESPILPKAMKRDP